MTREEKIEGKERKGKVLVLYKVQGKVQWMDGLLETN